jgi:hypothetical protein
VRRRSCGARFTDGDVTPPPSVVFVVVVFWRGGARVGAPPLLRRTIHRR